MRRHSRSPHGRGARLALGTALLLGTVALAAGARAVTPTPSAGDGAPSLGASDQAALAKAEFVYIASTRKDGSLSTPAEIWFQWSDGAVWVASSSDSWRAKRIRWGRPMAKIWIGSRTGPSFRARGEIVRDPARYDALCDAFAVKYPAGWPRWEKSFRDGLRSGARVLIRYAPVAG